MVDLKRTEAKYVSAPEGLKILHEAGIPVSKGPYYEGLHSGQIPHIRVGVRFYVRSDIVELMQSDRGQRDREAIKDLTL